MVKILLSTFFLLLKHKQSAVNIFGANAYGYKEYTCFSFGRY